MGIIALKAMAQAGELVPLNDHEQKIIAKIAKKSEPLFP